MFLPKWLARRSPTENNSDCAGTFEIGSNTKCQPPALLTFLPLEVRQQIWNDVFGGIAYHLGLKGEPVVRGWLCLSTDPSTCDGFDCYTKRTLAKGQIVIRSFSLLLACRQIYSEAIESLYSSSVFIIADYDLIQHIQSLVQPHPIDRIANLYFIWSFRRLCLPYLPNSQAQQWQEEINASRWVAIWQSLSKMHNLRKLEVRLAVGGTVWDSLDVDSVTKLSEPIRAGTWPDDFTLLMPSPRTGETNPTGKPGSSAVGDWQDRDPWENLPCKVQKELARDVFPREPMSVWQKFG